MAFTKKSKSLYKRKQPRKFVKKSAKKYSSKSLVSLIKKVTLKQSETKYNSGSIENTQLFHNGGVGPTYVFLTNMLTTAQGQNQSQRLGDEVIAKGLSIKLWLSNKLDRPNVMYRIILLAVPPQEAVSTNPSGLFKGSIGNKIVDYIDTDKYKVIKNIMIKPFAGDYSLESGATNKEHSTYRKIWIPLKNRKIVYSADNGAVAKYQNNILSLAVIAYDSYGSITTDNIASFACVYRFYFKDP